jgi:hypothetical protein
MYVYDLGSFLRRDEADGEERRVDRRFFFSHTLVKVTSNNVELNFKPS